MASIPVVFVAYLGAILFFSCIGGGLARLTRPSWAPAAGVAPALGWGVFTAVSFPLQTVLGFTQASTTVLVLLALLGALALFWKVRRDGDGSDFRLPIWAFVLAAVIAAIPLAGLLPKHADGGIIIGPTAFDHSKIAMVDEMTRLGLPAGNPFFGAFGARSTLPYYYLWHFGAAQLSILTGLSGWEADAAMTGVTAYASLLLMMGLACRLCVGFSSHGQAEAPPRRQGTKAGAAVAWVAILSLTGSLRPLLFLVLGQAGMDRLLSSYRGLAGWVDQASWVPQHMASACCVVLAVLLLADLSRQRRASTILILGALAAGGFGSSAWVGGVTFVLAGGAVGLALLIYAKGLQRVWLLVGAVAAAGLDLALAFPLLHAEFGALAARQGGSPIGFHPYEVVGSWAPSSVRRLLDLPAYWLFLAPIDLPAIYPAGALALALCVRSAVRRKQLSPHLLAVTVLTVASLAVGWLLISTIGNNDLGWRAILPALLILTPFAATGLARWIGGRVYGAAIPALALVAASVPDPQISANLKGRSTENAPDFADSPALWSAVRKYAGPNDRVANNPQFLDDLTDWPVNPSWSMLANRPSCFSAWETARAYVDLPLTRITALDQQFTRVFNGTGSEDDVRQMAQDYGCKVVAVIQSDGAWAKDPFFASPYYKLVETRPDQWRIYVANKPPLAGPGFGKGP